MTSVPGNIRAIGGVAERKFKKAYNVNELGMVCERLKGGEKLLDLTLSLITVRSIQKADTFLRSSLCVRKVGVKLLAHTDMH